MKKNVNIDKNVKKKLARIAVGAMIACVGAIILLWRSAMENAGEPDTASTAAAILLMAAATVAAFYVRKKSKEEIERAENPPPEPVDEDWEALVDYFYDMDREKEFYSCLKSGAAIQYVDDYEDGVAAFEKAKAEAVAAGSAEYIWRTSRDTGVCSRCRRLNGRRYSWDNPPLGGHPGCAPGCRCKPEPVMPSGRQTAKAQGKR
ncbi:MAG: minor capsid protein [Desulfovibrionaceae bacterium]|nr:minor capsid protein [Desulfovibrionaceae bacterium]